ncbi:hypothetical protein [Microscilla marina]|uniref:Lipoprotein, putative n=1 Tax=Microscilla marina ATCC 23134 TaxID=313606 RepID=A1ZEA5_MICM2|nr:hypothetical protein [Microscilla marina]EAY31413.1 lipoprotein, putative [Microscilla marina ATCC 23134]
MKITSIIVFTINMCLLLGCGNAGKPANDATQTDNDRKTETKKTPKDNQKATPEQVIAKKWKESFDEMYTPAQQKKLDEFELKEMKNAANNSFYEFNADKTYTITKPDEVPGKGKWEMSSDAKKLILHSAQGQKDELSIEILTPGKVKLKIKDAEDVLVLIPA